MTNQNPPLRDALTAFKDWSNYVLVTTVAAVGWLGSGKVEFMERPELLAPTLWCLGVSAVFGILTLALVPLLAQQITGEHKSIYEVPIQFRLFGPQWEVYLTQACRPQHLLFIAGIMLLCAGNTKVLAPGVIAVVVVSLVLLVAMSAPRGHQLWNLRFLRSPVRGKPAADTGRNAGETGAASTSSGEPPPTGRCDGDIG